MSITKSLIGTALCTLALSIATAALTDVTYLVPGSRDGRDACEAAGSGVECMRHLTRGDGRGNVSLNPGVALSLATSVQTIDADAIKVPDTWENSVRGLLGQNLDGLRLEWPAQSGWPQQ